MSVDLAFDREALRRLCERWRIVELAVFGSAARGEMRPDSDIDLMITFAVGAGWSLWDLVELREELAALFGRPVDLVESGSIRNPFRRRSIERDLTPIYAA